MPLLLLAAVGLAYLIWKGNSQTETDEDDDSNGTLDTAYALFDESLALVGLANSKTVTGFIDGKATEIGVSHIGNGLYLRSDAAQAFLSMQEAARADGVTLKPTGPRSAFRTSAEQLSLTIDRAKYAAPVNRSHHQAGTCIDLETANGTNEAFDWLVANASDYGFKATVPREPWHWEYV